MKGISEIIATILMLMITLGISGTAYIFISGAFTQQTQGLEVVDAYCIKEVNGKDNATLLVRNLGTVAINKGSINVVQTTPSTATDVKWSVATTIAPGTSASMYDECEGTGSRSCIYRIIPAIGRSIIASISCS